MSKSTVHVDALGIKRNYESGSADVKVLTVRDAQGQLHLGNSVVVRGRDGHEVGRFVYDPTKELGQAHVWFETDLTLEVSDDHRR